VLQLGEEALDQIALAVKPFAEAGLPFPIGFGRDVRCRTLLRDQCTDTVGIIGLVCRLDGVRAEMVEQLFRALPVVRLPGRQADPDRERLPIDDRMDFGREPASGATETMISIPLFAVAACWWARTEVLSIIWMSPSCAAAIASIIRSHTPAFRHRTKRL
jgi:hypothetical protein